MGNFLSIQQAAKRLKLDPRTVRERCQRESIGWLVNPRLRMLTIDDLEAIRKAGRPVGNPNFKKKKPKRRSK